MNRATLAIIIAIAALGAALLPLALGGGELGVTIKQTGAPDNILVVTDNATDGLYAPRRSIVTPAGAAITNGHGLIPIAGTLTVSLAQGDALTGAVVVTARIQTL